MAILVLLALIALLFPAIMHASRKRHGTASTKVQKCEGGSPIGNRSVILLTYLSSSSSHHSPAISAYRNWRSSALVAGFSESEVVTLRGPVLYENWRLRTEKYLAYTRSLKPSQPVVLTDAFDVLVSASPSGFLRAYEAIGANVVFGAETLCDTVSCRHDPWIREQQQRRAKYDSDFMYLNAGTVMGTAKHLTSLLEFARQFQENHPGLDDQAAYVSFWLSSSKEAVTTTLDYESRFVAVLSPQNNHENFGLGNDESSVLVRKLPGERVVHPCTFHFPSMKPRPSIPAKTGWFPALRQAPPSAYSFCEEELVQFYNFVGKRLERTQHQPFEDITTKCDSNENWRWTFEPIRDVFGGKQLRKGWHSLLDGATSKCNRVAPPPGRLKLESGPWGVLRTGDYVVATRSGDVAEECESTIVWEQMFKVPPDDNLLTLHLDADGALRVSRSGQPDIWSSNAFASGPLNPRSKKLDGDQLYYAAILDEELVVVRGRAPLGESDAAQSSGQEQLARSIWKEDLRVNRNHRVIWSSSTKEEGKSIKTQSTAESTEAKLELVLRWRADDKAALVQPGRENEATRKKPHFPYAALELRRVCTLF